MKAQDVKGKELIGGYTPKRTIAVIGDAQAHYEAARTMARDHVMHIRNRTNDPWEEGVDIKLLDAPLRHYYKHLIEAEYHTFVTEMEIRPQDTARWVHDAELFRFWDSTIQTRWEGWLCARLGFLPRNPTS